MPHRFLQTANSALAPSRFALFAAIRIKLQTASVV